MIYGLNGLNIFHLIELVVFKLSIVGIFAY